MSKAAELAALIGSQTALSNRNLIINGAMQVAQRGTSAASLGNGNAGYHTVDRFRFAEGGTPTYAFTMSQSTTAPTGFSNSLKMDCTTADTSLASADALLIESRIEAQNLQHLKYGTSSAESITLSFWVRSNLTGTYAVWFYQEDDNRSASKTYTINSADTWEHKSITVSGDQTGVIDNDNGTGFRIGWYLGSGTSYTSGTANTDWQTLDNTNRAAGLNVNLASSTSNEWYITGVQLEVGEQATPFEHRSFGDELARCQRYFISYGIDSSGSADHNHDTAYRSSTPSASNTITSGNVFTNVSLPVPLRTGNITFTAHKAANGSGSDLSNTNWGPFVSGSANAYRIAIQKNTNNMTTNQTLINLIFSVDAEL